MGAVLELICKAFDVDRQAAEPIFFADPFFDLSHKWLLFDGEQPVSTATVVPLEMQMGGWYMRCAGIAGVATDPSQQGKGYASRLLRDLLVALPEMGYVAAALVPNRRPIYERLGFVMVGERIRARLTPPIRGIGGPARWASWEDADLLARLYRLHGGHRLGALRRGEERWHYVLWQNPRIALFGDPPAGYAVLSEEPGALVVKEVMPPAPYALPPSLLDHQTISITGRVEDLDGWIAAGYGLIEPPVYEDHFMARILDLPEVIRCLARLRPEMSNVVAAADDIIPRNSISLRFSEGTVMQSDSAAEQVPIGNLTRALFCGAENDPIRSLGLFPPRRSFSLYPCDYF
ncbi:MAG: GNAT family N-acetyltransferase [Fimbriimonadia bacterium]